MLTFRFKTALLIDDNKVETMLHTRLIKHSFIAEEIIIKYSAKEALDFIAERILLFKPMPDIIFIDISMPMMDGVDF